MIIEFIAKWLPIIVAAEAVGAGAMLLCLGRWGSAIYWLAAAMITVGVIMIPKWG